MAPETDRRRLIVVRHAKAEPFAASDHERALTPRGRQAARDAGSQLGALGVQPDVALVSSARRTQQTWAEVETALAPPACEVRVSDELFSAGPETVLEAVGEVAPETRTVVFVGHNPTAAYVCHQLDDGAGDPAVTSGLLQGFPPAAFAVLELSGPWTDLTAESCRIVGFGVGA